MCSNFFGASRKYHSAYAYVELSVHCEYMTHKELFSMNWSKHLVFCEHSWDLRTWNCELAVMGVNVASELVKLDVFAIDDRQYRYHQFRSKLSQISRGYKIFQVHDMVGNVHTSKLRNGSLQLTKTDVVSEHRSNKPLDIPKAGRIQYSTSGITMTCFNDNQMIHSDVYICFLATIFATSCIRKAPVLSRDLFISDKSPWWFAHVTTWIPILSRILFDSPWPTACARIMKNKYFRLFLRVAVLKPEQNARSEPSMNHT